MSLVISHDLNQVVLQTANSVSEKFSAEMSVIELHSRKI